MKNLIFDGENYYLFRSLNDGNMEDLISGKQAIRTDSIRYYEKNGQWGKYNLNSVVSLEEVYDHIKMQYRRDTNCISLTQDANVAATYHSNNKRYILVRVKPEDLETGKVFDAGRFIKNEIEKAIALVIQTLPENSAVKDKIEKIEKAASMDEIKIILQDTDVVITSSIVGDRQYLTSEEQLSMSQMIAKLRYLESEKIIGNIISNVENTRLLNTMGNAYTSSEYIHYGGVPKEEIMDCPNFFLEVFSLLEQAKENGVPESEITRISGKVLNLVKEGFRINTEENALTNGKETFEIRPEIVNFLMEEYSEKQKLEKQLTIEKAFELTKGKNTYQETRIQLAAIQLLAEAIANKRAIVEVLKKVFPEEKIQDIFDSTICIHPEMVIKQNGRGNKISNTVNLLIAGLGYELTAEETREFIEKMNALSTKELVEICKQGSQKEKIRTLLLRTKEKEERIQSYSSKKLDLKYMIEAIIEGYDWRNTRPLTKKEKDTLADRIGFGLIKVDGLRRLYQCLNRMIIEKREFEQDEIFAIMMNIAIDGKIGDISYQDLLKLDENAMSQTLWQNVESLQTVVDPINLDLLMKRGKVIQKLKDELIQLGVEENIVNKRDVRNLYIAKKIVEEYEFERKITPEEKRAILQDILRDYILNINKSYLSTLVKNLKKMGLTTQEVYGSIIYMAVNKSAAIEAGYSYSVLLRTSAKLKELKEIKKNVDEITINISIANNLTEKEIQELRNKLRALGVSQEILEKRDIRNLYIATKIIEDYKFDSKITSVEKRAMIEAVLKNSVLNRHQLSTLLRSLSDVGFSVQEVYGCIINMGVYGNALQEKGYDYSSFLLGHHSVDELKEKRENIQTKVNEITIQTAISNYLKEEEIIALKDRLRELGIEEETLETKSVRNLYMALKIVENFSYEREMMPEEKRAIIENVLRSNSLNKEKGVYLTNLAKRLSDISFNEQEVYESIIYMAVNSGVRRTGYSYESLLCSYKGVKALNERKKEIQIKVNEITIQIAKMNGLKKQEIETIKKELEEIGIPQEIIETRDVRNLYMALQIVQNYKFEKEINSLEKRVIVNSILQTAQLHKEKYVYIASLAQTLNEIGLTEQEAYGCIINMALNGSAVKEAGYEYTKMLSMPAKFEELKERKNEIQTNVNALTIQSGISENLSNQEIQILQNNLIKLGISQETIESKDIRNLYIVTQIVEGYEFERALTTNEKRAIIESLLKTTALNKNSSKIITLAMKLNEIGLTEQEIYGTIINVAVNGRIVKETGYDYFNLIARPYKVEDLKEKRNEMQMKVNEMTIQVAEAKNLTAQDTQALRASLKDIGVSPDLIETRGDKDLYMATQIVEEYNFEREITKEEKKAIIQSILSVSYLSKLKDGGTLITLANRLNDIGLNKQEIYGSIINMAVNESATKETGYSYGVLLQNPSKVEQLSEKKEGIQTKVNDATIQTAIVENLSEEDMQEFQNHLREMGVSEEVIEIKDNKNLYMATQIVEGYKFERTLTTNEKRALILSIVGISKFNKGGKKRLTDFVRQLSEIGLSEQEVYGSIINMAVNSSVIEEKGYHYTKLLNSSSKIEELREKKDHINTTVSEETIKKAQEQPKKIMKKAISKSKEKGSLSDIDSTRKALRELQELGNPIPVEQD